MNGMKTIIPARKPFARMTTACPISWTRMMSANPTTSGGGALRQAEPSERIHGEAAHVIEDDEGDRLHHSGGDHQRSEETGHQAALARLDRRFRHRFHGRRK